MPFELRFDTHTEGDSDLEKIARIIAELGKRTSGTSGELKLLESVLKADVGAGQQLSKSLQDAAASSQTFTAALRKQIADLVAADAQAQKSAVATETAERAKTTAVEREAARRNAAREREIQQAARAQASLGGGIAGRIGGTLAGSGIGIPGLGFAGANIGRTLAVGGTDVIPGGAAGLGIAAFAAASAIIIKAANSLGEYAKQQENLSQRTGLSTQQTQLFSRAAGIVDVNANTLAVSMRTLSKALSENSEEGKKAKDALSELGLTPVDSLREMGDLLPLIYRRLAELPDGAEKDRIAIALFGRSALELIPLIDKFDELTGAVRRSGAVIDQDGIQAALQYQRQIKELELAWTSLLNSFKQKAVADISLVIHGAKSLDQGLEEFIQRFSIANNLEAVAGRGLTNEEFADLKEENQRLRKDLAPKGLDPSRIRSQQRESEITAINQQFQTPKERLDERIKKLREDKTKAEDAIRGAATSLPGQPIDNTAKQKAEDNLRNVDKQIQAAERQRDALKEQKVIDNEILTLKEQLRHVQDEELTGIQKINAESEALIEKLRERKKLGAVGTADYQQELRLIGELKAAQTVVFEQRVRRAQIQNQRRNETTVFEAARTVQRDVIGGEARIDEARGRQTGEDQAGIDKAKADRLRLAEFDFQTASKRIKALRDESAEREAVVHDQIRLDAEQAHIRDVQIQTSATYAREYYNANRDATIQQIALNQREADEKLRADENQIRRERVLSDITAVRNRTIAEGRTRLSVVNAAPGFQLQAELTADAKRLAADRQQAELNRARNEADIAKLEAQRTNDPKKDFEIEERIKDLRLASVQEAAKIEIDTLRARQDAELRIAEDRKSREREFRSTVVGFLQASRQGRGQEFLRGTGENLLNTITGNVAGLAFPAVDKIRGGVAERISGTADAPTFLGKILAGTPFGPAAKNPIDRQITSTERLTSATDKLRETYTAVTTGQPIPGGLTGASGLLGGFGSLDIPGLGALGSAIKVFGSDTNGLTGHGGLTSIIKDAAKSVSATGGGSGEVSNTGFGGFLKSLSGNTGGNDSLKVLLGGVGGNKGDTSSGEAGGSSRGEVISAAATTAAAAYGAEQGIVQLTKPGARNKVAGVGKIAASALAVDPDPTGISQTILGAVALGSTIVSAILGNEKEARRHQIEKELNTSVYQAPTAQNRTQDIFGHYTDFDKFGKLRTSDLSAIPQVTQPYITRRDGTYYDVPGQVVSQFGGGKPAPPTPAPPTPAPQPVTIINQITAWDGRSVRDAFQNNPNLANEIVHIGLTQANGPAQSAVRRTAGIGI